MSHGGSWTPCGCRAVEGPLPPIVFRAIRALYRGRAPLGLRPPPWVGWNTRTPAWVSSSWTGAGPSGQLPAMDYRPPTLRWVPSWAWRAFYLLLGLGILYQLGAWIWGQLSG